jgi:hypothetical protein
LIAHPAAVRALTYKDAWIGKCCAMCTLGLRCSLAKESVALALTVGMVSIVVHGISVTPSMKSPRPAKSQALRGGSVYLRTQAPQPETAFSD